MSLELGLCTLTSAVIERLGAYAPSCGGAVVSNAGPTGYYAFAHSINEMGTWKG
jgi:hypothetical protein